MNSNLGFLPQYAFDDDDDDDERKYFQHQSIFMIENY